MDKNTEASLYLTVLDSLDDAVCVYNEHGDFVYVNSAVVKIRGISRQEYLTMNVHDLYESKYINICVFDRIMESKREFSALQQYRLSNLTLKPRLVTGFPIFDANGHVKYVVTVLRDILHYQELYQRALHENRVIERKSGQEERVADPIAESPKMKALLGIARNIAGLDSSVVLSGESGTGKEVLAHYIHNQSPRHRKPMVEVNCAALPETLLDAELFGYEKGSFTGALNTGKVGLIESANGSTLFLDEINSLPLGLQGKLLKAIEEKRVKPLGSVKDRPVDFRLIVATNVSLEQMVREGQFRADLFYRLNVVPMRIPPLREHKEDIIPLCMYFLEYFSYKYGRSKRLSHQVIATLTQYDWPGNVRELRNAIERLIVMTPPNVIHIRNMPAEILGEHFHPEPDTPQPKRELTRESILEALELNGGHRERTAQYLGISRRTLQYKLKEMGLTKP